MLCVLPAMHGKKSLQPDLLQDRFYVGGKTLNITIQLILQQCCNTIYRFFFVVRYKEAQLIRRSTFKNFPVMG